jgi:hypothetical protein
MSELRCFMSMSLDGFVAGPKQSAEDPFGVGGLQLHEWTFPLAAFREGHGEEGGEVNASTPGRREAPREHWGGGDGPEHVRRRSGSLGR